MIIFTRKTEELGHKGPVVVMMHNAYPIISRGDVFHAWNASTVQIKNLINFLYKKYEFIDETFLLKHIDEPEKLEGKLLLTFDDGYANLFYELKDFLNQKNIRPHLFLIEQAVRNQTPVWYQKLAMAFRHGKNQKIEFGGSFFDLENIRARKDLYIKIQSNILAANDRLNFENQLDAAADLLGFSYKDIQIDPDMSFLSIEQLKELISLGWTIGSHGVTHTPLGILNDLELKDELRGSRDGLIGLLATDVSSISYPNGQTSKKVIDEAKSIYKLGYMANHFTDSFDPLRIPRFDFPRDEAFIRSWHIKPDPTLIKLAINEPTNKSLEPLKVSRLNSDKTLAKEGGKVLIICGPNQPERYAVSKISKCHNLVGLFVHNYTSKRINVVSGLHEESEFEKLEYHIPYDNEDAKLVFGPFSLAYSVPTECDCYQVTDPNHSDVAEAVKKIRPDVILVFGTSLIRTPEILNIKVPKLNLHWGKSPYYRGSNTLRWPIIEKDASGLAVTVHELTYGIDSGPIIAQSVIPFDGSQRIRTIEYLASVLGVSLFEQSLDVINSGIPLLSYPQDLNLGKFYAVKDWMPEHEEQVELLLESHEFMREKPIISSKLVRRENFVDKILAGLRLIRAFEKH